MCTIMHIYSCTHPRVHVRPASSPTPSPCRATCSPLRVLPAPHPKTIPQCNQAPLLPNKSLHSSHLKFARHHAARCQCCQVQLQQLRAQQPWGHVTSHNALRQALHNRSLAHTCTQIYRHRRNTDRNTDTDTNTGTHTHVHKWSGAWRATACRVAARQRLQHIAIHLMLTLTRLPAASYPLPHVPTHPPTLPPSHTHPTPCCFLCFTPCANTPPK